MDLLVKTVHFLATHLWLPATIAVVLSMLQIIIPVLKADRLGAKRHGASYRGLVKNIILLSITMVALVLGIFQLPDWSNKLIYNNGRDGTGIITRMERTNNMYNNQYIMRYYVLLKKGDGETVETQFKSSAFNVYPSRNRVTYPRVGEEFAMRYLFSNPKIFVILSNKASAYTERLFCEEAFENLAEAKIRFETDSLNNDYRHAYIHALKKLLAGKCYKGSALEQEFIKIDKATIRRLENVVYNKNQKF